MKLIDKDKIISMLQDKIADIKLDMKCGFLEKRKGTEKILMLKHIISLVNTLEVKEAGDKALLLKYLYAALPYGIKIMVEGWDSDMDCEFTTVETLIGIDDRFIHTIWDKTGNKDKHSIIEPKSILNYKPYLRTMSSMTEEEVIEFAAIESIDVVCGSKKITSKELSVDAIQWLLENHFDFMGLISKSLAIEVTEFNNPYKE